ncbi:MAG: hypothetical protein KKA55_05285 [Proteobacteria bacterium]|nr:hypothetical protein [Pseudomonadota bacterium]MBU1594933.1 hypothetical protein [Pseudomonadota bacterium]
MSRERPGTLHLRYQAPPTIALFMKSSAFYRGLMGPVGSGKSSGCCMELMRRAFAQPPGPDGLRRSRMAVLRNTYRELKDTTLRTWLSWFPEDTFGPFGHSDMRHAVRLPHPSGGDVVLEVLFRALDRPRDVRKLLSLELTGAWVNEAREMPLSIVEALGDRVERYPARREGGCAWAGVIMDTNPPDSDHWWHRLAEESRPEGWAFFRQPGGLLERQGSFVPNVLAENLAHLPKDFYLRRMAGKSPAHVRVYYCAQYGFVQDGLPVYPEFCDSEHVSRAELLPVDGLPLYVGLDFGLTPAAVLGQRLASGRWIILDELVSQDMGMVRFAGLLLERLRSRYGNLLPEIWGDPAGMARAQTDERTPFDILRASGLQARPAPTNDPLLRREAVAAALSRSVDGEPGLVLSLRCPVLRKGMAGAWHYRRVQVSGEARFVDVPDKNRFSHVCEAAQYMLVGAGEGRRLLAPKGPASPRPSRAENRSRPDSLLPSPAKSR